MDAPKGTAGNDILKDLEAIVNDGIQTDRKTLTENMCSQFKDPKRWIVEYVNNSYDAKATRCIVYGTETADTITISVEDNGHGMDRQGVVDFATLFRSVKQGDPRESIGRFGVGKLSPAAVPGQCGFVMETSTGKECWRMTAGSLLSEEPIRVEAVIRVPERGTRFEITFKKEAPLKEELKKLAENLKIYNRFLPLRIVVFEVVGEDSPQPSAEAILTMQGNWQFGEGRFEYVFELRAAGRKFDAAISLCKGEHEVYQNRVYITNTYNLLSHDLKRTLTVPHLSIRVDSRDFETPFGRHRLSNEHVLSQFSKRLREGVLPPYLGKLFRLYEAGRLREYGITPMEVQDIASALLAYDSSPEAVWSRVALFSVHLSGRCSLQSLNELRHAVRVAKVLYLESQATGADLSLIDGPVLALKQPEGALEFLKNLFAKELVNLAEQDVVVEAKPENAPSIGESEKRFKRYLGFHPAVFRKNLLEAEDDDQPRDSLMNGTEIDRIGRLEGASRQASDAQDELAALEWTVNYLVAPDGRKPCLTHRFTVRGDRVVLNLYHPEVRQLIEVSEKNAALAGHLALAMCLTGEKRVLPHLTSQMCEELLAMDAIAKCGADRTYNSDTEPEELFDTPSARFQSLRRDADDTRRWVR